MPTWKTRLKRLAELNEGRRRKPYVDTVGKVTIGIGRNLTDVGLSDTEVDDLYENDFARKVADLDRHLPWWRQESPVRRAVLYDLAFNMGIGSLMGFRNTLAHWKAGRYEHAARGLEASLWYRQVKTRGARMVRMVRTNEWPPQIKE